MFVCEHTVVACELPGSLERAPKATSVGCPASSPERRMPVLAAFFYVSCMDDIRV